MRDALNARKPMADKLATSPRSCSAIRARTIFGTRITSVNTS